MGGTNWYGGRRPDLGYIFSNLATRMFFDHVTLTCTHDTTFERVENSKELPVPTDLCLPEEKVTSIRFKGEIKGAQITQSKSIVQSVVLHKTFSHQNQYFTGEVGAKCSVKVKCI